MAARAQFQTEPIPGYRLVERLGSGGFGEVWKATAPGGQLKAVKIVHGDAPQLAAQELKALRRVQSVRHPHLLAIERYDILDGRLLIVTELADGSLWDRFRDCRREGKPGVPREELLRYLDEAAAALDLMDREHHLQHLDVKPQNLFLVGGHLKVGDFGLVADLSGVQCAVSAAATPVYAAPETFDAAPSRHSDQYSLAIVYQELLTGQRPFNGGSAQQVIRQHLQLPPNLAALPAADRPAVARALAKAPEDRFLDCAAFVRALREGTVELGAAPAKDLSASSSSLWLTPALTDTHTPSVIDTALAAPRPERTGDGVLMPALVIGLGGTGRVVLQRLRQVLTERFGPPERLPHLRLLYVDTDADAVRTALGGTDGPALAPDEVLPAPLRRAADYQKLRSDGRPWADKWCDPRWLEHLVRHTSVAGIRGLGRLAFADHFRALAEKMRGDLAAVGRPDVLGRADLHTRLGLRSDRPRVFVVAGLAGGTGGGMAIDVAYLARYLLRRLGHRPEVAGWLLAPPAGAKPFAVANAYAALTELHHYSQPTTSYRARCDEPDGALNTRDAPFGRLVLLPVDARSLAADGLARELLTPLGRTLEARSSVAGLCEAGLSRTGLAEAGYRNPPGVTCRTFGLARYAWPKRTILERAGRRLARRLLERWARTDDGRIRDALLPWVTEQWAALDLGPESLARHIHRGDPPVDELVHESGVRMAGLAACLIEQPGFRLAGAEAAIGLLDEHVAAATAQLDPSGDEPLSREAMAVYATLRTQLADQRQEVALCRTQLVGMLTTWQARDGAAEPPADALGLLLPDGCRTPEEAADCLLAGVTRDDLRELDRRVQPVVQERVDGLARACLTDAAPAQTLGAVLLDVVRDFLAPRLDATDPAELFLAQRLDPATAWVSAAPVLAPEGAEEIAAVAAPPGPAATALDGLARVALPDAELVPVPGATGVAFYREVPQLLLANLPQLGPEARAAYQRYRQAEGFTPHARADVLAWSGVVLSEPTTQRAQ